MERLTVPGMRQRKSAEFGPLVIVAVVMHRKLRDRLPGLGTPLIVFIGMDPLLDPHLLRKVMGRLDCCLSLDTIPQPPRIPLHFPPSDVS